MGQAPDFFTSYTGVDRARAADITYIPTWSGWLYLAVILDVFSRQAIGQAMANHPTKLVINALGMAIWNGRLAEGLVHHSDQGCEYTYLVFGRWLREAGRGTSMGSVGDCSYNAITESSFATLESKLLHRRRFRTRIKARVAILDFLEGFYNPCRCHLALGQPSFADCERSYQARPQQPNPDPSTQSGSTPLKNQTPKGSQP